VFPEPYQPTAADLQDFADWSERVRQEQDLAEQREFWRRNPLSRFNEERGDD
jgi:hypothetical protein